MSQSKPHSMRFAPRVKWRARGGYSDGRLFVRDDGTFYYWEALQVVMNILERYEVDGNFGRQSYDR